MIPDIVNIVFYDKLKTVTGSSNQWITGKVFKCLLCSQFSPATAYKFSHLFSKTEIGNLTNVWCSLAYRHSSFSTGDIKSRRFLNPSTSQLGHERRRVCYLVRLDGSTSIDYNRNVLRKQNANFCFHAARSDLHLLYGCWT